MKSKALQKNRALDQGGILPEQLQRSPQEVCLQVCDSQDNLTYESGDYYPITGELVHDLDLKIYEARQVITQELAALLPLSAGESFHLVLHNIVFKINRIPP